jgi:hypothetical protein
MTGSSLEPLPKGGRHVLFVGNSLTYTNDLPATLAAIAASAGDTIRVATEAGPNLALIDHLTGGSSARERIAQGGWEYVILQQGPTPAGICRDSLVLWTKLFNSQIRAVGAKPAVLMVWPIIGVGPPFDDVRISFQMATESVDGTFCPLERPGARLFAPTRLCLCMEPMASIRRRSGLFSPRSRFTNGSRGKMRALSRC